MKNILILVSGIPGTGKTSFAAWLAKEFCIPLVCYDNISKKVISIARDIYRDTNEYPPIVGAIPFNFLWFNTEEIMKTSSPLIVEYFFNEMCRPILNSLISKYQYKVVSVHFDADDEIAYERFNKRNQNDAEEASIRPREISLTDFIQSAKANREFRHNDNIIYINTNDFTQVSYEDISRELRGKIIGV